MPTFYILPIFAPEKLVTPNRRLEKVSEELSAAKGDLEQKNEALQQAGSELEQRVKERTAELDTANKVLGVTQQNMHTVIKHSADGLLIVDDDKNVRFMNPAAEVILGRRAQDLLGEPFGLPLTTDKPSEVQLVAADGSVTIAEMQAVRTEWENEAVYMATIRDITLLKKAQQEMEAANEQLRKFNDLKDEFVSMASHELRTPLSIIIGAVKLVLDEIPGKILPEQKDILDTAMRNVKRLAGIVDSLLSISKIESGRLDLQKSVVNICQLIATTICDYEKLAKGKGIQFYYEVSKQAIRMYVDPDKIREVIINLVSNSIKFTPEGGLIKVDCAEHDAEVLVSVQDSGIGIAEENIPKLFNKFTQFGRKAGPGEKGTGLGLAICKGILGLHKGRIWAESELGKGTKFTFAIPKGNPEELLEECINDAICESLKNDAKTSLIAISIANLGILKLKLSSNEYNSILRDIRTVLETNLRRGSGDVLVPDVSEIFIMLPKCDKEGASIVKARLECSLNNCLALKNLADKIETQLTSVTYPDDARTAQDLVKKAKELSPVSLDASNI